MLQTKDFIIADSPNFFTFQIFGLLIGSRQSKFLHWSWTGLF